VRLRIWRGLSPLIEGAASDAARIDADLSQLYDGEAPYLRKRLARRVDADTAADLVQSAFARFLGMGAARIDGLDQPRACLIRIADNLAKDEAKSARRRAEPLTLDIDDCPVASPDPHSALEARDMLRRIEIAISRLPVRTREIFLAHRFENLTYAEIADRMDLSIKTVEKHISIALRQLYRARGTSRDR
jgi:RNA polymerase sigma-70 factor (ECF subfamily)